MPEADTSRAPRPGFALAVGVTVWLAGLLVAFMLGMGSAYVVASGIFVGSRVWARLRSGPERRRRLEPGDRA